MNRFDFLKMDYREIYKLCAEADKQRNVNKARQALEVIIRRFDATKQTLFDRICEASEHRSIPKNIVEAMHQVRIIGNRGSHDDIGDKINDNDISKCMNLLFEIVVWLTIGHDKCKYKLNNFLEDDIKIVNKYRNKKQKLKDKISKRDNVSMSNSLCFDEGTLNFNNDEDDEDEFTKKVFETLEEYEQRINNFPLYHIGYGILDKRERDKYIDLVFLKFYVEKSDTIIIPNIDAIVAKAGTGDKFIDGRILSGLKLNNKKVCCDFSKLYLQGDNGDDIKLNAICLTKQEYETDDTFNQKIKSLPILPLGVAKPVRKKYDIEKKCLPFKIALYRYVQPILKFDEVFVNAEGELAKNFCTYEENFLLYGKLYELMNADKWYAILRHANYEDNIKCCNVMENEINNLIDKVTKLAKQGDVEAQYKLGMYFAKKGQNVPSKFWLKKAAEKGHKGAYATINA